MPASMTLASGAREYPLYIYPYNPISSTCEGAVQIDPPSANLYVLTILLNQDGTSPLPNAIKGAIALLECILQDVRGYTYGYVLRM